VGVGHKWGRILGFLSDSHCEESGKRDKREKGRMAKMRKKRKKRKQGTRFSSSNEKNMMKRHRMEKSENVFMNFYSMGNF